MIKIIILKSKSLRLDMNISMSELFSIYSSGEGSGSARFTFNIPDDYQKKSEEIPKPVVQKKKKML